VNSGNVTDEMIMENIRTHEVAKDEDEFKVEDAWVGHPRSGFQPTDESNGSHPALNPCHRVSYQVGIGKLIIILYKTLVTCFLLPIAILCCETPT
jgi:hypothetical protein